MALPVPRRKLRPAPYATCCCGGAPVPVRRLPRRPMFKVDATVEAPLPDVLGTIKPVPRFGASAAVSAEEVGSARLEEERERKQLAIVWLAYAKQVAAHSECLRLLEDPQPDSLVFGSCSEHSEAPFGWLESMVKCLCDSRLVCGLAIFAAIVRLSAMLGGWLPIGSRSGSPTVCPGRAERHDFCSSQAIAFLPLESLGAAPRVGLEARGLLEADTHQGGGPIALCSCESL